MNLNQINFHILLKSWFEKSIIISPDFQDIELNTIKLVIEKFKMDYLRYFKDKEIKITNIVDTVPLQGILCYRIARELFLINMESYAIKFSNLGRFLSGIELYYSAEIGEALKINHGIGTVVGARTRLGSGCLLHQNVTLGDKDGKRPNIGDNVIIYPGAKVIGGINIGDDCIIGANSVVFINVPNGKKVVGVPGKIL